MTLPTRTSAFPCHRSQPTSIMAPKTRAQGPLPFSIWVRRKYRWWPGSERYGGLTDRLIMAAIIAPGGRLGGGLLRMDPGALRRRGSAGDLLKSFIGLRLELCLEIEGSRPKETLCAA